MKRAVITVSVGDRPWFHFVKSMVKAYAEKCNADFFVETDIPEDLPLNLPVLDDAIGRKNKSVYALKSLYPYKYLLKGYDQVLCLDDTVIINPKAPSIFDLVTPGFCGITTTSANHALKSFNTIQKYVNKNILEQISYNSQHYANSAVVLYDKACIHAISPSEIEKAGWLLEAQHPHQTLLYYLFSKNNIGMEIIPKSFNSIPGMNLVKDERFRLKSLSGLINKKVNIYHITGGFENRFELIESGYSLWGAD